jgi:hypothetical protein
VAPPTTLYPSEEREVYVIKETVPGTIPASAGVPIPILTMKPSDKPQMLWDESLQGSMGDIYGGIQGILIASLDLGGNFYADTFGHLLLNVMGDYTVSGTAQAPAGTTNAGVAAGALALPVASGGASFTAGMQVWIQDAGTPAANEVVTVGAGSTATSVVLAAPGTRFAHLTATPFTNTLAPYFHVFAVLNGLIGAPNGPSQPATHCFTDRTLIPATGLARQYAYTCLSELVITGNSEKLLAWTGKATCYAGAVAGSAVPAANVSTVQAQPSWRSVTGLGSPGTYTYTATSAAPAVFTAAGSAFTNGQALYLDIAGLPAGFATGLTYYVVSAAGATFSLALTPGGTGVTSSSTGSGVLAVQRRDIAEWQISLSRAVKPYATNQGVQIPYAIGRGKHGAKGKLTISPAIDESYLIATLANQQPQFQVLAGNGLTGAALGALQADILLAAYETADLEDASELFGYQVPFTAIHTAAASGGVTATGASGGKGAVKLTLVNAVPSY